MASQGYIPALDGIRSISVLIVLVSHAGFGLWVPGGLGVTTFFFLSGFLITTLLENEFKSNGQIHIGHFFLRRFFRLFPPLAIVLLIAYGLNLVGIVGGGSSISGLFAQLLYFANYHQIFQWPGETPTGLGILWSLAVEEHFYLFFPFLFNFFRRCCGLKATIAFITLSCIGVLCWRLYLVYVAEVSAVRTYYATDTRIDSILYGCLFALTFNPTRLKSEIKLSLKALVFLAASGVLMLLSVLYRDESFRETFRYSVQGIALMPLFFYAVLLSSHPFFSWLNLKIMRVIGVYSYCIYLIHFVIIGVIKEHDITNKPIFIALLTLAGSVGFAYIIDRYVDCYFQKLRKRFR